MRNCEWKMGMKEETCWGSTGSYSGLYGIFQTISFLVVKGDFEKNTSQIYSTATQEQNAADAPQPGKQGKEERYI